MGSARPFIVCAVASVAVFSLFAFPASAMDYSDGDYWVYEGDTSHEGILVSGGYRLEFIEQDSLTIGSESYGVNVLKMTGSMSGETGDFAGVSASVEMVFDGYMYMVDGTMATVKEDIHTWTNLTFEVLSDDVTTRIESQDVSTYSPPSMAEFAEGETGTGAEWNETTNVSTTTSTWLDGVLDYTSTAEYAENNFYSVASAEEQVTTEAGEFTCLKVTVTHESGNFEVFWYSSDAGNWVKVDSYWVDDTTPSMSLELTDYQYSGDSAAVLFIVGGAGLLAAVVVVIVILLLMRRRGRTPAEAPVRMSPTLPGAE